MAMVLRSLCGGPLRHGRLLLCRPLLPWLPRRSRALSQFTALLRRERGHALLAADLSTLGALLREIRAHVLRQSCFGHSVPTILTPSGKMFQVPVDIQRGSGLPSASRGGLDDLL